MSDLLKAARIAGNDDEFRQRVEAACWTHGVEFDDRLLHRVAVASDVLGAAHLSQDGTISTDAVTDAMILAVVQGSTNYPDWQPDTSYYAGDRVQHSGTTYEASKNHSSKAGQTPDTLPDLWAAVTS